MKLYFQDPDGQRLAIDTDRREWAANYANNETELKDGHNYINVSSSRDLYGIEQEADFCSYDYNGNIENGRPPQTSVYSDYLRTLASYSAATDTGQLAEHTLAEFNGVVDRVEKARAAGYFSARQYAALILIIDDIRETLDLYYRTATD